MPKDKIMLAEGRWMVVVFYACIPCNAELGATENLDNEWVVRLSGGPRVAQKLADEMGYKYQGSVTGFKDTYIFTQTFHPSHQKRAFARQTRELNEDKRVSWAEQQHVKSRQKRHITIPVGAFIRTKRNNHIPTGDHASNRLDRTFNDELWSQEWYLQDTRTRADLPKLDLNVLPVYRAGITGNGVRVTILDDGIEYLHEDLKDNYDPDISWDCNENDADPTPRYDTHRRNSHGTR
ncbi:Furin 1 [Carabus blaptoides fortunei]